MNDTFGIEANAVGRPFRASFGGLLVPGLKTWAELCSRFATGRFAPRSWGNISTETKLNQPTPEIVFRGPGEPSA
jgi:hypothetical protein